MCAKMMHGEGSGGMDSMGEMKGGRGGMRGGMGAGMMGGMGGGMMNPRPEGPGTVTVGSDGAVYVLRGSDLYKFDADLKLVGKAALPAPPAPQGAPPANGPGDHRGHH